MMDEFENNRENEHVDQTPHAETPYDTGDGNTDNLKRTEQQTEQTQVIAQQRNSGAPMNDVIVGRHVGSP